MKLEKIYKDIFEANVGDKLFADIDAAKTASMSKGFSKDFKKWVEQVYGPDYEPNTPEEEKMFWALGNYFGDAGKGKELGAMVDDLKALKSQFPNMLNPTNTTLPNEGYAYRGAKLPIAQYEKLIRKSTPQWGTFTQHARVDNPGITYKSRGQYGFTSFTIDYEQAEKFANSWKEGGDFVNVVYGVKLDNPNLVVNPSFANRMSEYPEDETLYVGNSITPDVINIVDPRFIANVLYDMKAYEEENDLPEYSVRVKDFYPNWAKTHTPRLEDFNLDGTPKKKEDKKVRLDKKSPEEQAKIDKLKALQAKKYGIKENTSLYKVYTEILTEVGGGTSEPFEQICKDLYEALNVGDKLWGAEVFPGIDLDVRFVDFLHKLYAPDFEPNTVWEDALLRNLKGYFSQNKETKDLGPLLKGLLPLKSKFPRLLDPAQFKDVGGSGMPWESGYEGYAWRGATMPLKDLQRLIPQSRLVGYSNEKDPRQIRIDGFAIDNPNFVYKSRGGYGFTSFSLDAYTAGHFRGMYQDDRITVVYGVKLTDPNLIMNPDVSNLLSDYKEYETLYVGDKVKPDVIMVTDRRVLDQFKDDARKAKTENPLAYFDDWKRKANITPSPEFPNLKKPEVKSSSSGKNLAAKYAKMKGLMEIYTEIQLSEVGELDPSKALPFELKYDNTRSITDRESGVDYVDGFQEYTFKLPSGTRMGVILRYEGDGKVRIDFNPVGTGDIPVLGDTFKSAYTIMNTVGTIVKDSLKNTLEKGITKTLVTVGKNEYSKKNPEQRQQMYTLFIKKAFPGAVIHKSGMFTALPDDYEKYL